jgi:hypothetical protein
MIFSIRVPMNKNIFLKLVHLKTSFFTGAVFPFRLTPFATLMFCFVMLIPFLSRPQALCRAVASGENSASTAAPKSFVSRHGTKFYLHDSVFYFAGANIYDLFTYGNGGNSETDSMIESVFMDKARIDSQFTRMEKYKVRVLRTWMFNHQSWHGFEPEKGNYSEPQFRQFDYIIESAKKHNVLLVPVLENYWEAYGGIDAVLKWEGLAFGQAGRWKYFKKEECPGCFTDYKNYVAYVVSRVNHYSKIAYKDEPAIFAWDLMNEPRYEKATPNEDTTGITLRLWMDTMAAYVKSIDKNHMVYAGFEGQQSKFGYGGDCGNPFVYVQASPNLDFTSAHPYPTEGWAALSIEKTVALIRTWKTLSFDSLGKPFFMGEFNAHNNNSFGTRSAWWKAIYDELESDGANGSAFWWFSDRPYDNANFGVTDGSPELSVFTTHSGKMSAKNASVGIVGPSSLGYTKKENGSVLKAKFINSRLYGTHLSHQGGTMLYSIGGRRIGQAKENSVVIEKKSTN